MIYVVHSIQINSEWNCQRSSFFLHRCHRRLNAFSSNTFFFGALNSIIFLLILFFNPNSKNQMTFFPSHKFDCRSFHKQLQTVAMSQYRTVTNSEVPNSNRVIWSRYKIKTLIFIFFYNLNIYSFKQNDYLDKTWIIIKNSQEKKSHQSQSSKLKLGLRWLCFLFQLEQDISSYPLQSGLKLMWCKSH